MEGQGATPTFPPIPPQKISNTEKVHFFLIFNSEILYFYGYYIFRRTHIMRIFLFS